jgi:hypothetical protein
MTVAERYRSPWSMSEVNKLHNEYEVKNLPILEIAKLHKRGAHAILHRLAVEGLILDSWADVKGWKFSPSSSSVSKSVVSFDESEDEYEDPYDSDYVYESDEDDDYLEDVVDDDETSDYAEEDVVSEQDDGDDSSDYEDEVESVDSDSDYEDEREEFDPYSIKQKAAFLHNIIGALKFFVYAV